MDIKRETILKHLTALDFMAVDLHLYLDTHPYDREALNKYNWVNMQAGNMRSTYERLYGPLTSYRSLSAYPWQWINNPWPWSYEFNFDLAGEEE